MPAAPGAASAIAALIKDAMTAVGVPANGAARIAELKLVKPADRRWRLAVCGHHRSPQVELGDDFETTWDPKGADFTMMLGEFYCREFDAPLLVEIKRAGTVFARVYDIRGRSYDTLLTQPGLTPVK